LEFHFLAGAHGLGEGFVLDEHVGALGGEFIAFDLDVADEAVAAEQPQEVLLVGVLGVVAHRGVDHGNEVLLDLLGWIVADHVEAFEVVSEENFEVWVVRVLVEGGVDVVVVRAGVRGVLHFEVFHENEIFDYFNSLHFPVPAEEVLYDCFGGFVHAADVQLADEDAFVDVFGGVGLGGKLFLLCFRKFHVHFVDAHVVVDGAVADGHSDLLVPFLLLPFLIVALVGTAGARAAVVAIVSAAAVIVLAILVTGTMAVLSPFRIRDGIRASPVMFVVVSRVSMFVSLPLVAH
jgi:hypothetical protein